MEDMPGASMVPSVRIALLTEEEGEDNPGTDKSGSNGFGSVTWEEEEDNLVMGKGASNVHERPGLRLTREGGGAEPGEDAERLRWTLSFST